MKKIEKTLILTLSVMAVLGVHTMKANGAEYTHPMQGKSHVGIRFIDDGESEEGESTPPPIETPEVPQNENPNEGSNEQVNEQEMEQSIKDTGLNEVEAIKEKGHLPQTGEASLTNLVSIGFLLFSTCFMTWRKNKRIS